jgi:biopolymer transport protein ExbD
MRKHYTDEPEDTSIDMTPMLDIVFIMLIFFVVTTSFVKETGIDIQRPSAQTAERQERGNILVAIDESGGIWVDRRRIELGAVRANIERLRAEYPGGSVVVQADENSRSGLMVAVMDQIRLAGVENIAIAAQTSE